MGEWVLDASYTRLKDLGDSLAYCQLMDQLYPNCGVLSNNRIPAKNMFDSKQLRVLQHRHPMLCLDLQDHLMHLEVA